MALRCSRIESGFEFEIEPAFKVAEANVLEAFDEALHG